MEDEAIFRQKLEGQLYKYTNVVKGWQYRWFILDPQCGTLEYYMTVQESKNQKVRGSINLGGAVISPSEEDDLTFTVSAANGDVYRLRAPNGPRERQQWVTRLRAVVERQVGVINAAHKYSSSESLGKPRRHSLKTQHSSQESLSATQESLQNAKSVIHVADEQHKTLVREIESLPGSDSEVTSLDPDVLLLKATSQAAVDCLDDCLTLLQKSDVIHGNKSPGDQAISQSMANISYDVRAHMPSPLTTEEQVHMNNSHNTEVTDVSKDELQIPFNNHREDIPEINPEDEFPDGDDEGESKLEETEEHKSVILHLLSQLKLGMDLTRVVLPTFILEKRSLLEMYADFLGHADQFLRISQMPTSESRMLAAVEYYICSFHTGRKGSLAKKPYNPIIGETFNCSYDVPATSLHPNVTGPPFTGPDTPEGGAMQHVRFMAEQVSHHPPVSAFYAECPPLNTYMNGWIWTKSKFLGMSVGVTMVGEGAIHLVDSGEVYRAQFPAAYGRSILTVPWMELGGKVTIQCTQTGYHANITFHTKPFYGGKVHRISGEVKNPDKQTICQISGEWNGRMEMSYSNGDKKVIDTARYPACPKKVRPISKQGLFESRRLWQHVTASLRSGDVNTATEHKKYLEEQQRKEEKARIASKQVWETKHFHKDGDAWTYKNPLKPRQATT